MDLYECSRFQFWSKRNDWGQFNETFTSVAIVSNETLKTKATLVNYKCKSFTELTPS